MKNKPNFNLNLNRRNQLPVSFQLGGDSSAETTPPEMTPPIVTPPEMRISNLRPNPQINVIDSTPTTSSANNRVPEPPIPQRFQQDNTPLNNTIQPILQNPKIHQPILKPSQPSTLNHSSSTVAPQPLPKDKYGNEGQDKHYFPSSVPNTPPDVPANEKDHTVIEIDPYQVEAVKIMRNFTKNKLKHTQQVDPNRPNEHSKGGVLGQLLQLQHIKGARTPVTPRTPGETQLVFLQAFFGIGSPRTSLSDDGSNLHQYMDKLGSRERKVAATIESILKRQDFLILLGKASMLYGSPTHRMDANMKTISRVLEVESSFCSLPGLLLISFGDSDTHTSETHIVQCKLSYDMDKLDRVIDICDRVTKEDLLVNDATAELKAVMESPPLIPPWCELLYYIVGSFAVSILFFDGNFIDALLSGALGAMVGLMMLFSRHIAGYANLFELSAALVSSFIARSLSNRICHLSVSLSATVILLPGLSLTTALIELTSKNIISGVVKTFYALVVAFILGFGMAIGERLSEYLVGIEPNTDVCSPVSPYWKIFFLPLAAIAFSMDLRAHPRQWPIMIFTSSIGFGVSYLMTEYKVDSQLTSIVSAFVLGIVGNLYGKFTRKAAIIPLLGGIIMLVPGSIGVKGLLYIFNKNSAQGSAFALNMVVISLCITAGLFLSALIVYPFGRRRSALLTF
ncbi:DUF1212-domain-containing protein [Conidiobolus coronatus NRRL 28638]|uniref:DUF1212-domain-containing protein n=1 Tax=Conidiobolus coronatus (strain ATCC 28846 / CBS 209.66 / NRRL 28638) TaxID=796925 RepID=A0A137P9R1_CONC2|nr:DUF1212-domain-containing protein [Conidiobolus coronatus NRRL 28638]|eukprot:KXN71733.1 DUF1212-domain-containing protein [Conidiobolus coronatus NRRL 28638]